MTAPALVVVVYLPDGQVVTEQFEDLFGPVRIGSAPACEICIPAPAVHPVHCEVVDELAALFLIDRSDGGMYSRDAERVTRRHLPAGAKVIVALRGTGVRLELTSGLEFQDPRGPADKVRIVPVSPSARARPQPLEEQLPALRGEGGRIEATLITPHDRDELLLNGPEPATIGRSRACAIRIPDDVEGVSGTHARLAWINGWLVLEDLDSTNGTWLADHLIKRVVLRPWVEHHIELGRPGASLALRVVLEPARVTDPEPVDRASAQLLAHPPAPASAATRVAKLSARAPRDLPAGASMADRAAPGRPREAPRQRSDEHERRRHALVAEWEDAWRKLDEERRALQAEPRPLEAASPPAWPADVNDTMPMPALTAVADANDPAWLREIPEPDRGVLRHLTEHGRLSEADATCMLGGARQCRQFNLRLEAYQALCPFTVRIETAGEVKCYVRTD